MTKEEQDRLFWAEYGRDQLQAEVDQLRKEQDLNEKQTEALYEHLKKWAHYGYRYIELLCFDENVGIFNENLSFRDWAKSVLRREFIPDELSVDEVLSNVGKAPDSRLRAAYEKHMQQCRERKQEVA